MTHGSSGVKRRGGDRAVAWALAVLLAVGLLAGTPPGVATAEGTAGYGLQDVSAGPGTRGGPPETATSKKGASGSLGGTTVPGRLLITTSVQRVGPRTPGAAGPRGGGLDAASLIARGLVSGVRRLTDTVSAASVPVGGEAAAAVALQRLPGVRTVEPVRRLAALATPNDPDYPRQWAHQLADAPSGWDVTTGSRSVLVAVVDSGIVGSHPDLRDNLVGQYAVRGSEVSRVPLGSDNEVCRGDVSHATLVAGVIGALGDNQRDVAGVAWRVGLLDVAVFRQDASGACFTTDEDVIAGISTAVSAGARVVNLSLGGPATSCGSALQSAVDSARRAGALIVAAAGNSEQTQPGQSATPASCNGVVSVGAVGRDGTVAPYSAHNPELDLVAPGGDSSGGGLGGQIVSTSGARGTAAVEGTSFAAPYVAGAAALLLSLRPDLAPDAVESVLERTAVDKGTAGRDSAYGHGLVQVGAALRYLAARQDVPPPAADPVFPVGDPAGPTRLTPTPPRVVRLSSGTGPTRAIEQAVAVSQAVFTPGSAAHVVLARDDVFADALAGSALGFGVGPLLFTASNGPLATATAAEIRRVLPPGGRVYLLGGTAVMPAAVDNQLRDAGFDPRRLAGTSRDGTAAAIAQELKVRLPALGYSLPDTAVLATGYDWPDAVSAGSLAAYFGMPVLLATPTSLPAASRDVLSRLRPRTLLVVGGTAAVSEEVLRAAATAAGAAPRRVAGVDRDATAVAVAREFGARFAAASAAEPPYAVAVNLRRTDGFAHVLSASAVPGAFGGVFLPVEGEDGSVLPGVARDYLAGRQVDGVLVGGPDLVTDAVGSTMLDLLR